MYKNQLQELAQRSCFNLPSYSCFRQGPDHAPRFRASVNFNGEIFQSPSYCTTLRQAEHSAAEVALNTLSIRGPSRSLTAKVIDETGVYKNLIQETAHRAGLNLPVYTTIRSGPGHVPVFTCTVELASMSFTGEGGKTKKQAEKNAAFTAWSTLKQMTNKETESNEEQEQVLVARVLSKFNPKDETKEGKQRNQNQARKRLMVPGYRDSTSIRFGPSCQNSNSPVLYQQRRSMELLSDFYPSRNRNEQKSKFLAPLPSPPCPPNRTISVEVKTKSQVNSQEIRTPLDEHRKDEEEWLYGKAFVTEKSIEKESDKANSDSGFNTNKPTTNHQFPIVFPPFIYNPMPDQNPTQQTKIRTSCYQPHRRINGGGFLSQNMAPAVQVRSVIPVCATPPMVVDSSSSSENLPKQLTQLKEASPTSIPTTVSISTEQKTIVASSLKMNNLQL